MGTFAETRRKPVAFYGVGHKAAAGEDPGHTTIDYEVEGVIATASVATLNATPVTVIAAPGAGKFIQVHWCHWMLDHGGTDFDGAAAGEDLSLKYTNASGAKVTDDVDHSGFGDASADAHAIVKGVSVTPVANAAVVAHILSGEWYAAAGDSDLRFRIRYSVHDLNLAD